MNLAIKRVFCILMAFLICCTGIMVIADEQMQPVSDELNTKMEVLRKLGFISDYYDYNTLFSEKVSRADFARMAAKLINAEDTNEEVLFYYDVPKSHYAYNSIIALTKAGVINGTGNKRFEPEQPIMAGSAYKIILSLMGYDKKAEIDGGYPMGYIRTANRLGIYNGEAFEIPLTRGGMLNLIYDAMKTKLYEISNIIDGGLIGYKVSEDDTLLSLYHNIYYGEDIVYGANKTTLDGTRITENEVKVGKDIFTSEVRLYDKLGEEIEFFYYKKNEKEKGNIIWAKETGDTNVIRIDENSDIKFDNDSFELSYYNQNGSLKKVNIDRGITVIYNGFEVSENIEKVFEIPFCNIKLVELKNTYYVAIAEKAETYVVGNINLNEKVVYDKVSPKSKVDFDAQKYEYFAIEDKTGNSLTFEDISKDAVLNVFQSYDKKYVKVVVSLEKVSGVVTRIKNASNGTQVFLESQEYLIPVGSGALIPKIGDNVNMYLDYKDYIVYTETISGEYHVAYIFQYAILNDGFDNTLKIKVFSQNGEVSELKCADKVVCDGKRQDKIENILATLNKNWGDKASVFKPQLVMIKQNNNGEITGIDTAYVNSPYENDTNTLSPNMPKGSYTFKWTGFLAGHGVLDSNTVIFNVPDEADVATATEKEFSIKHMSDLVDGVGYTFEGFKTKQKVGYEQFVVLYSGSNSQWDIHALPFLVSGTAVVVDEEGMPAKALIGYNSAAETEFIAEDNVSFENIKPGMLVRLKLNKFNQIEDYTVLFDPETELDSDGKIKAEYQTNHLFNDVYGVVKGYVNDVVDGVIKIGHSDGAVANQFASKQTAPVLIYDRENEKVPVTSGEFEEAKTYYNYGDECSIVVMQSYYGTPKLFVIYK